MYKIIISIKVKIKLNFLKKILERNVIYYKMINLNNKKRITVWVFILVMVMLLFLSGPSIAKGTQRTNIEVNASIAVPIVKIEGELPIYINTSEKNQSYEFKIKNYDDEENLTQVDIEYTLEISKQIDNGILIKVYKEGKELKLENNKTEKFTFEKNQKQEDNYKIEILFINNSFPIEEMEDNIDVKIYAEQKINI